ncbi:MAG TPA: OsmC family protein, partial [Bryobacteraceae bacterium]|nr:OsmC family protein [Bryobacteraceae bacterium]
MKNTHATVHYAGNDYFVAVPPTGHAITLDVSPERSNASGPLELLLVALGGCTGADVISVLHKKRQQVTDYRIEI